MKRRTFVIASLSLAGPAAVAAPARATTSPAVRSSGTVVVAKHGSTPALHNVGTSTVTVQPGATVRQVLAQLASSDSSRQAHKVLASTGAARSDGRVRAGDRLVVQAEDGRSTRTYKFALHDPNAPQRDGVYWNAALYEEIDRTVNTNTPVFPDRRFDITAPPYRSLIRQATETYAVGNEAGDPAATKSPLVYTSRDVWFYGDALRAAIQDCHRAGGGIVVIPSEASRNDDGAYYTGAITLLSGVNLHVSEGAVVKFMRNRTNEYYPVVRTSYEGTDMYGFSPLIYALHQRDIAVTGGGTLDGQEDMWNWRPWKKGYWGEPSVEDKTTTASYGQNGILNQMNFEDTPIETRVFSDDGHRPAVIPVVRDGRVRQVPPPADARPMRSSFRPSFIQPNDSTNVLIEGVRIRNIPFWTVHPLSCTNVLIRDLNIYSNKTTDFELNWNNDDGIDPESCRNVVMENNHVTTSDDGAAVKAGRNVNGREHRAPSERIIIRDSVYRNDGGDGAAISMGSEMSGSIRDVFIHDSIFGGPDLSLILKIKTNSTRGGLVERVYVRDCLLEQSNHGMVQLDANYRETVPFPNADVFDPTIRDIYVDRVNTAPTMSRGKTTFALSSSASRSPVEGVHYRDSTFHTTSDLAAGFASVKIIKNFVVDNVTYVNPDTGATTRYNTKPLDLLDRTRAVTGTSTDTGVHLTPVSIDRPDIITPVPADTFTLSGAVDLTSHPHFPQTGTIRAFLDRDTTPITVHLSADGTFHSDPITLNDDQPWYRDRHYVAINFYDGIDINTEVYQVTRHSR
ncbi:glycosyl hydrolase family 28 protein [Streptomyces sp. NPDC102384]|uniref:glycosyl hydrolase family 28 protein n=1 Tax=Streptomyces sp. NPDC102384 TaxID=3366166 RepID=UPI003828C7B1